MLILTVILAILAVLLTILYRRRINNYGVFKRMGIPGPEPHWLFGNLREIEAKNMFVAFQDWTKQFGKCYGVYKGTLPMLVSSDLDFLQEIFITRFSNFHGREMFSISPHPDTAPDVEMFTARGNRWKRLRSIVVPTFSTAKLKKMSPLMRKCVNILVDNFEQASHNDTSTDVYKLYQGLTLQVIAECGMGWAVESQTNPKDPFLVNCQQIFATSDTKAKPLIIRISEIFRDNGDFYWAIFQFLSKFVEDPNIWLLNNVHRIIDMRKAEGGSQYVDLLQLMINAEATSVDEGVPANLTMTDDKEGVSDDVGENGKLSADATSTASSQTNKKALTIKEMEMQIFLFIIAGYETTSTALAYCSHLLALHPAIQTRVQEEIDTVVGQSDEITFEMVQKMTYLHAVFQETLRLYPVAAVASARLCMEECTVKGICIPKDMLVSADVWSIHHDPEIWPDPEKFDPERFTDDKNKSRHPLAWLPFGAGPRNCVGMRFALVEAKLALASVLRKYSLKTCDKSENPLRLKETATVVPQNGLWVSIVERQ